MTWLISTGTGLTPHSAHESLEDAMRCVHDKIVRGREDFDSVKWDATTGDDNGASDGTLTLLSWNAPSRKMTAEEIDKAATRVRKAWRKCPPLTTDWERTERIVTFIGERTDCVSICREDRHRQYLQRAGLLNDVTERTQAFENLVAAVQ